MVGDDGATILSTAGSTENIARLCERLKGLPDHSLDGRKVFALAGEGDAEAAKAVKQMVESLARAIYNIQYSYDPECFVIGGGITAARKYIMPSLLKELRGKMHTITGEELNRVQMKVYDLDNEEEFKEFAKGDQRALKVYGTDRYVADDPQKRIGVMISKLGASNAISVGAYAFALSHLDAQKQQ